MKHEFSVVIKIRGRSLRLKYLIVRGVWKEFLKSFVEMQHIFY